MVVFSFIIIFQTFILEPHIKGFYASTKIQQVCLLIEIDTTKQDGSKTLVLILFSLYSIGAIYFVKYLSWRVNRFLFQFCPRKQMSCIGKYMRNVISLNQTANWYFFLGLYLYIGLFFQLILIEHANLFSKNVLFWIWNSKGSVLVDGLFLIIPLFLQVPPKSKSINFYMTNFDALKPRQALVDETQTEVQQFSRRSSRSFRFSYFRASYISKPLMPIISKGSQTTYNCKVHKQNNGPTLQ